jgi:hypothetical protein
MSVSIVSSTNAVIVSRDRLFNHLITARNLAMQPYSTLLIDGLHPLTVDPSRWLQFLALPFDEIDLTNIRSSVIVHA